MPLYVATSTLHTPSKGEPLPGVCTAYLALHILPRLYSILACVTILALYYASLPYKLSLE